MKRYAILIERELLSDEIKVLEASVARQHRRIDIIKTDKTFSLVPEASVERSLGLLHTSIAILETELSKCTQEMQLLDDIIKKTYEISKDLERGVFIAHFIEGKSITDVARVLNYDRGYIKNIVIQLNKGLGKDNARCAFYVPSNPAAQ